MFFIGDMMFRCQMSKGEVNRVIAESDLNSEIEVFPLRGRNINCQEILE